MSDEHELLHLDHLDEAVLLALGSAVARAQLLEWAMAKLLDVQEHDLTRPVEERWDEITGWLELPAGRLANKLGVPASVAGDLHAVIDRRNLIAHKSWVYYRAAREHAQGDAAADEWVRWFADQGRFLDDARRGVLALTELARTRTRKAPREQMERLWRQSVPAPIERLPRPHPSL